MMLNKSIVKILPVLIMASMFSGCHKAPENQLLVFHNTEQDLEPYQSRIIITPTQMRFDDGEGSKSYTLFDRKNHIARTIDTEQRTVLELHAKSVKIDPPFALNFTVKDLGEMKDAPKIMGKTPRHYQDYANDQLCFDVITVDGLMPDAVQALREFQELLASDSAVTFNSRPADLHEPCSIAMSTFAPTRFLQHGFPIQQWQPGFSRMLVDFKSPYQPDPKLFEVPTDYFSYSVQQIREGLVDLEGRKIRSSANENTAIDNNANQKKQ
jgi:hypothetical protein